MTQGIVPSRHRLPRHFRRFGLRLPRVLPEDHARHRVDDEPVLCPIQPILALGGVAGVGLRLPVGIGPGQQDLCHRPFLSLFVLLDRLDDQGLPPARDLRRLGLGLFAGLVVAVALGMPLARGQLGDPVAVRLCYGVPLTHGVVLLPRLGLSLRHEWAQAHCPLTA